jgi:hypothetical protein
LENERLYTVQQSLTPAQELEALHTARAKSLVAKCRAAAALESTTSIVSSPILTVSQATPPKVSRPKRSSHPQPGRINPQPGRINPQPGRINPQPGRINPQPGRINPQPGRIYKVTLEQKAVRAAAQRLRRSLSK